MGVAAVAKGFPAIVRHQEAEGGCHLVAAAELPAVPRHRLPGKGIARRRGGCRSVVILSGERRHHRRHRLPIRMLRPGAIEAMGEIMEETMAAVQEKVRS